MVSFREERRRSISASKSKSAGRRSSGDEQSESTFRTRRGRRHRRPRTLREAPIFQYELERLVLPNNGGAFAYSSAHTRFSSASEAACAILMECFIPEFRIREGVTFQIPLTRTRRGHIRAVDFCVHNALVEYHPIPRARCRAKRPPSGAGGSMQGRAFEARRAAILERYRAERQRLVSAHPEHADKELIVVSSPAEFYERVIRRFSVHPPPLAQFLALFFGVRESIERNAMGRTAKRKTRTKQRTR